MDDPKRSARAHAPSRGEVRQHAHRVNLPRAVRYRLERTEQRRSRPTRFRTGD